VTESHEHWVKGDAYEPYIGRWSRPVAKGFVEWLDPRPGCSWLDVGCGTGALTEAILEKAKPDAVVGVDPAEDFVAYAGDHVTDARAVFGVRDALNLPGEGSNYDYVVSGLVLNFVPDSAAALAEMKRVTRSGGTIAAYVWDYSEGMEMLRIFWDAARELDDGAADLDEGARFPICRPEALESAWERAGLHRVDVVPIEIDTVFRDFDDFWKPFLGGQGPAPTYTMSLPVSSQEDLRGLLLTKLGVGSDGSIPLRARAWAVRGIRSE
jgi:SAM-dependent methyltransferase